ncbi:DEAD/DEAH box helicase family protein [Bacillus sp. FSL M7-0307]|uniref:DEAD/DEAH box helicase family protein n=1 Tax=Bacillus TaxID=1386 RepID=UPI00315AC22C|nr:DEAD/DEAH box helicase family protein [Bacillus aerophilus]
MKFRIRQTDNTNFDSPQEMYKDYKKRTIKGTLDYQSKMIDIYMKQAFEKRDVAFELPTGSGKTLIGLLIGEYRRRKNKEKVVYLCPNNQLVHQVVEKAKNVYGIKVNGFTGKIIDYPADAKSAYNSAEAIAVTNYSSLFNTNSFFSDADILIFDDAHSSENYIASNWSLEISRFDNFELYSSIVECIRGELDITQFNRMTNDSPMAEDEAWFDKLPNIKFYEKIKEIYPIIDAFVEQTKLRYSWANIKNHLHACNMFISWQGILIRPYIPPTQTHLPFTSARQRIYMSATLGESGELERITGVKNIHRLPMVADWDKKSIGRRFFVFPNSSFNSSKNDEVLLKINEIVNRSLHLVQDDKAVKRLKKLFEENTDAEVFLSKDIEKSKEDFINSNDGIAILANRYDGIDMDGDKCHMLVLGDLPSATHLQEKFFTKRMAASVLFNERVRTRVVQAIGRCTRSDVDFAAVCVFGNELESSLISPKKVMNYQPELRAEIEFGYEQSTNHESIEGLIDLLKLFFERGEDWEEAEKSIIGLRDKYIEEGYEKNERENFERLKNTVKHEVEYQYALWKEDYDEALKHIDLILPQLDGSALKGYKGFWNYAAGFVAFQIYKSGKDRYLEVSKKYFKEASNSSKSINWFNKLLSNQEKSNDNQSEDGLFEIIERIESQIINDGIRNNRKFERKVKQILENLNSNDGNEFERGHQELGTLLGYISQNSEGVADPDPWWIINDKLCIVSEDKIYESETKPIPVKHVKQAATHKNWIIEKLETLRRDALIETIMITSSKLIEEPAAIHGQDVWYVNRMDFVNWAIRAIDGVRKLRRSFSEQGDLLWRIEAADILREAQATPNDFLVFIRTERLSNISKTVGTNQN